MQGRFNAERLSTRSSDASAESEELRSKALKPTKVLGILPLFFTNQAHAFHAAMPGGGLSRPNLATGNHGYDRLPSLGYEFGLSNTGAYPRAALRMVSGDNTDDEDQQSPILHLPERIPTKELRELPVPEMINALALLEEDAILDQLRPAEILNKVSEYVRPEAVSEGTDLSELASAYERARVRAPALLYTYDILKKKGILRFFGSCATTLAPLQQDNFQAADLEEHTGLPRSAFGKPTGLRGWLGKAVGGPEREVVVKHEAGHLLVAYLLGYAIEGCELNAGPSSEASRLGAQAGTVVLFPNPLTLACSDSRIVQLMAGIAAEAMAVGYAKGGDADLNIVEGWCYGLSWTPPQCNSRIRWGMAQAVVLLQDHQSAYKALCKALSRGASIGEAVMVIEGALLKEGEEPAEARKYL